MLRKVIAYSAAIACAAMVGQASAQENQAQSLEQLLRTVQQGGANDRREAQQRVQEFQRDRANQQQRLQQARATLQQEEARSTQLEGQYTENERIIGERQEQYQERAGQLNELFGVLQQVAGDTRSQVIASPISAEVEEDRVQQLKELIDKTATGTTLPSIDQIRDLYEILLQEMVKGAQVSRFNAPVIEDGESEEREVVRVGLFQLVSNGDYLRYDVPAGETQGRLIVLPAQPGGAAREAASTLQNSEQGVVDFTVDPLRGQLLQLQAQNPSLGERIEQGGIVGYIILGLGAIAIVITIIKLIYLLIVGSKMRSQMKDSTPRDDNPLGRVLQTYHDNKNVDVETLELKMDEAILKETPKLERGNSFVKIISVVAPLLGLFGTVTGMILTFQAITLFGTGDPKVMAGGISQALVTTVLGLTVAIPTVLLHSFLASRTKSLIHVLEEQAAGIIAVHAEKENVRV